MTCTQNSHNLHTNSHDMHTQSHSHDIHKVTQHNRERHINRCTAHVHVPHGYKIPTSTNTPYLYQQQQITIKMTPCKLFQSPENIYRAVCYLRLHNTAYSLGVHKTVCQLHVHDCTHMTQHQQMCLLSRYQVRFHGFSILAP